MESDFNQFGGNVTPNILSAHHILENIRCLSAMPNITYAMKSIDFICCCCHLCPQLTKWKNEAIKLYVIQSGNIFARNIENNNNNQLAAFKLISGRSKCMQEISHEHVRLMWCGRCCACTYSCLACTKTHQQFNNVVIRLASLPH